MKHDVLRHSSFFAHMEEFGYLRGLDERLPEHFTAVFEIARVLEDQDSALSRSLGAIMTVAAAAAPPAPSREWKPNRSVMVGEEYEAALMRNLTDLRRILPHQYLLPEDIFVERLARRSLWISVPRIPTTRGYGAASTDFAPNNFKQKVYLLLDTSSSMSSHHRFQMAKAVVYVFLKRNLRELGHIYFRTFDTKLGELHTATDARSLRDLIQKVMRLNKLDNGTVMEKALLQAAEDIRERAALSGAEILMVTDGACHLDIERIRSALGSSIRINTVKIGNAHVYADDRQLRDLASRGQGVEHEELARLEQTLRRAEHDLRSAPTDAERVRLAQHVKSLRGRTDEKRERVIGKMRERYGREIEILSRVFVNVDDIESDRIYVLRDSEIEEVRELVREVEMDFQEPVDADSLREAAVLYEHVQFLLEMSTPDSVQRAELTELARRLGELLKDVQPEQTPPSAQLRGIARSDMRDVRVMLQMSVSGSRSIIAIIKLLLKRLFRRLR